MSKDNKLTVIIAVLIIAILAISSVIVYMVYTKSQSDKKIADVNSFKACSEASGKVLETYPRQCSINGKSYTEEVSPTPTKTTDSDSFATCQSNGGTITNSFPRQCSLNGKSFTESTTTPTSTGTQSGVKYFKFVMSDNQSESFVVKITNPTTIKLAQDAVKDKSSVIVTGKVRSGNGGFNKKSNGQFWSWYIDPETIGLADFTTEVCDARPSYVEEHLADWKDKQYCPWTARISGEVS